MPVKRTGGGPAGAPKRTRFASPTAEAGPSKRSRSPGSASNDGIDDQFLDADITESNRKAKTREKRALRDEGGYGSDSSNDEESVVPSRRPGAQDEEEDEDVDMFGDADEDNDDKRKGKGKEKDKEKKKEFMDIGEIEGQEFARPTGSGDDDDGDSDSDEEAKAKRKTGLDGDMGVDITPFNMKKEMEEGRFTADGETYVENEKDPHEMHDMWLDGTDKDSIKKARRAHRERERQEREREARENEVASGAGSEEREHSLMREIVQHMQRGETILEAMQRLGAEAEAKRRMDDKAAGAKKKTWAERQKERKAAMQINETDAEHATPFARFSTAVADLQAIGQLDVYSLSREAMERMLPRQEPAPDAAAPSRPAPDTRQFQYRFSLAYMRSLPEGQRPVEREVFGPFGAMQLRGWKATGFFGPNCENIEVRVVDPAEEQPWGTWEDVMEKK